MIKTKKRPSEDDISDKKSKKIKTSKTLTGSKKIRNDSKTFSKQDELHNKKNYSKKTYNGNKNVNKLKDKTENLKPEDWSKFKKEKKELRLIRKKKKNEDLYELCVQAKKLGEKLRMKALDGGNNERKKICEELHGLLKGSSADESRYSKLVLAHDMTRVIQVMLKYSSDTIKNEIMQNLLTSVVPMLQSNYGRFCVKKMFKYGTNEIRHAIIDKFYGHVIKLTCNSLSNEIIDLAYITWANTIQKNKLKQEFYGDIYKNNKDESITTLADTYKQSEHMKSAMLSATKANLLKIINKKLLDNSLFHAVLNEFLSICSNDDRTEFISLLCPEISTLCSTKEGTKCALNCLWYATNKEKKVILRNVKEHVLKLAQHEHGHMLLLGILCGVDDTVLLNKILVNEFVFKSTELIKNEWGRKILLWLVAPGDTTYFHPSLVDNLKESMKNSSCKKSSEIREKEILDNCKDALCNAISENATEWLSSGPIAIVTKAVIQAGSGDSLSIALNNLAAVIVEKDWRIKVETTNKVKQNANSLETNSSEDTILGIEHAGLHMILKKIAQYDKTQIEKGNPTFGEAVVNSLKKKVLKQWLTLNRACFLLLTIIENCNDKTKQSLKDLLNSASEVLENQTHPGGKLLLKHI